MRVVFKIVIVVAVLAAGGYLFVRSAQNTRGEPYEMSAAHLASWTVGLDAADDPSGAAISLRPPAELTLNLFRQLFRRQMESLATPLSPGIALALRSELDPGADGDALLTLARGAGLAAARLTPRCIGYRRVSARGVTRQLYFAWFDLPEFDRFRALLAPHAGATYRPNALSPVLLMAAEPSFAGWHPVAVDEPRDCIAPIAVS